MSDNDPAWPSEGGDTPPTGSGSPAAGSTPPASGGTPPASGSTPPAGGSTPPAGGSTPPAGGEASTPPSQSPAAPPPPPAASGGGGGRPHAEFSERAIALVIDWVILFGAYIVIAVLAFMVGAISDVLGALVGFLGYAVVFIASIAIFVMGEGGPLGQTPGKHMRGIQVVKDDGTMLDTGGAFVRWLGRILDTIICGLPIGYLWPLFDDEDRCWHDIVASTRVVTGGPKGSIGNWFENFRR